MSIVSKMKGYDPSWHRRAKESIAQGALTNSKRPECLVEGIYPTHLSHGEGCFVFDLGGKRYIDFICGLGSNILGYGHTEVTHAIAQQALKGCTLSLSTELEVLTAEKVKEIFPFVERVKLLKTGSEACSAALRIARTNTAGRKLVYTDGYHGWHDEFVSLTPPALGVTFHAQIEKLPFLLNEIEEKASAVIIEPVSLDAGPQRVEWLRALRKLCTTRGILLIFDEIITGFRFQKMSVSTAYGVEPDLICLGKAIANGMAVSVVGGKASVMNFDEYFVSSTFAGESVSLAAALKTMELLQTRYDMERLWSQGKRFLDEFNSIWPERLIIEGYPTRGVFKGDPQVKALFWQESVLAGILFGPSWFFNFPHIDVSDLVLSTSKDILTRIKTGSVKLLGKMPQSPFAQKVRGQS